MKQYKKLIKKILKNGLYRHDRTITGTMSIFGHSMKFDISGDTLPLVTIKKTNYDAIIHELLWFLSGDTNIKYLNENDVHIWDAWADENKELGPIYGFQWRKWNDLAPIDQIQNVIDEIRTRPSSRRLVVSAWNPGRLSQMYLPPCHLLFQFYVHDKKISCQVYQRSCDVFLGLPFNIAQYAILTKLVAKLTRNHPHRLIWTGGDVHLYLNHIEQAKEIILNKPYPPAQVKIKSRPNIDDFVFDDFKVINYKSHPFVRGEISI